MTKLEELWAAFEAARAAANATLDAAWASYADEWRAELKKTKEKQND